MAALNKLSRLRAFSRLSLRRDGAPLTHRARQKKPAWAVANTSKYCLQTASNSRPGVNVPRAARLCARLVPPTRHSHTNHKVPPVVCVACTSGRYHSHCPPAPRRAALRRGP